MDITTIKQKAEHIYNLFSKYISAIYLGGSIVSGFINNPHDIDFITFVDSTENYLKFTAAFTRYRSKHKELFEDNECWVQVRKTTHTEISYWSYLFKDMILLAGTPVTFDFNPLGKDRNKYIEVLKKYTFNKNLKLKRYYHLYRGYLLLSKQSYDLTEEEIQKLNILHDAKTEEDLVKTILVPNPEISEDNPNETIEQQIYVDIPSIKLAIWRLK